MKTLDDKPETQTATDTTRNAHGIRRSLFAAHHSLHIASAAHAPRRLTTRTPKTTFPGKSRPGNL
jgi:hypothetical protein